MLTRHNENSRRLSVRRQVGSELPVAGLRTRLIACSHLPTSIADIWRHSESRYIVTCGSNGSILNPRPFRDHCHVTSHYNSHSLITHTTRVWLCAPVFNLPLSLSVWNSRQLPCLSTYGVGNPVEPTSCSETVPESSPQHTAVYRHRTTLLNTSNPTVSHHVVQLRGKQCGAYLRSVSVRSTENAPCAYFTE